MIELLRHQPAALELLVAVVVGCAVLVLLTALLLLSHHRFAVRRDRVLKSDIQAVAAFLAPRLLEGRYAAAAILEAREVWGDRAVVTVLRRVRQALRGQIADAVARALEEMGTVGALARLARSPSLSRRVRALRLLGQCGGRQAHALLVAALGDPRAEVRRAARESLTALRDDRSIRAAVFSYLRDPEQREAWRAGLFTNLAAYAPAALRGLVASRALEPADEKLALEALAEVGDRATLRLALARFEDESAELRVTAVRVVGKLEDEAGIPLIVRRLRDPEWIVRAAAARALGTTRCGALACWALGARLRDPVWWVRANAARTLAQQGELGVLALLDALEGDDEFARETAVAALAQIDLRGDRLERVRLAAADLERDAHPVLEVAV